MQKIFWRYTHFVRAIYLLRKFDITYGQSRTPVPTVAIWYKFPILVAVRQYIALHSNISHRRYIANFVRNLYRWKKQNQKDAVYFSEISTSLIWNNPDGLWNIFLRKTWNKICLFICRKAYFIHEVYFTAKLFHLP